MNTSAWIAAVLGAITRRVVTREIQGADVCARETMKSKSIVLRRSLFKIVGLAIVWSHAIGQSSALPQQLKHGPLAIAAPAIPPPLIQRIPLRVGLCLSPVLRGALITLEKHEAVLEPLDSANQEHKHWDLGNAVVATLAATTRASFEEVTILEQCAPNTAATGDLQAIVIAQLPDARVALPGLESTVGELWRRQGSVDLLVTLRSADGKPSLTWRVSGSANAGHALLSSEDDVAVTFSAALRNASARLLADLSLKPMVRAWFASIGAHGEPAEALPIAGSAQNGLPEDMAISTNGKIAILSNGSNKEFGRHTAQCLSKALESLDGGVRILEEDRARDAFFPWFEYDVLSTHSGEAVIVSQLLRERARQTGVDFIVVTANARSGSERKGFFQCYAGGGGAACLGAAKVQRNSQVTAEIWDLRRGGRAQSVTGEAHAQDVLIGFILPIWIPGGGSTMIHACRELAGAVQDAMHGDSQARLEPVAAPSATEPATDETTTAELLPEGAAVDAGIWSDELSLSYLSVRWIPGTADIGNSRTFGQGRLGVLRLTHDAMMFKEGSPLADPAGFHLPFDEIASVAYRTARIDGHIGKDVYGVLVTRKSGEVDSLAIIKSGYSSRADAKALAKVLQSKLPGYDGT